MGTTHCGLDERCVNRNNADMSKRPPRLEPARSIMVRCGGPTIVARALGLHRSQPLRWQYPKECGGTGGNIPHRYQRDLLRWAVATGIDLTPEDFFGEMTAAE